MTTTAEQLAQLREVAERANTPGSLTSYSKATALMEFDALITPDITLALLDELEATKKTSESRRDAVIRTHRMFQRQRDRAVAAEKRIAELECEVNFKSAHIKELQCEMKLKSACDEDGINLTVEG